MSRKETVPKVRRDADGSLHPTFLPSGYLWADMMLWDLRETVG